MACQITTLRELAPYKTLKRCTTHGIAWVEDGSTGTGRSAHPNVSSTGNPRVVYGKGARIVRCHGWAYNTDSLIVSDEWDLAGALACECGGDHELRLDGQTFAEWAKDQFEYEYCAECGGDAEDHEPWIVLGHWFAHCKRETA